MKVAITGASGFVGSALQQEYPDVVYVHRNDSKELILQKLSCVDVVINLAGAPIIKKWSEEYKKVLMSSRIDTTRTLIDAINESGVKHLISTSAVGIYPDGKAYDENTKEIADDFLGTLASNWEDIALTCNKPTTILRFGIILGKEGGALKQMLTPFRLGVGGVIGNGKAMMSWISIVDLVNIYKFIIDNKLTGIYNATAPVPVTNRVFTKALGNVLQRPTIFPLPEFVLKLIYGEAASVITGSKEIYPASLQSAGYKFIHPDIDTALQELLR